MALDYNKLIAQIGNAQALELPVQDVIDRLWVLAQEIALEDGNRYQTLRQAIAWLEVMRNA